MAVSSKAAKAAKGRTTSKPKPKETWSGPATMSRGQSAAGKRLTAAAKPKSEDAMTTPARIAASPSKAKLQPFPSRPPLLGSAAPPRAKGKATKKAVPPASAGRGGGSPAKKVATSVPAKRTGGANNFYPWSAPKVTPNTPSKKRAGRRSRRLNAASFGADFG